jgi:proteasome lid subunit RPN8/RPN11
VTARVALPALLAVKIRATARVAFPHECCGLLEGIRDGDAFRVTALHPARNIAATSDRFAIDPTDHFTAQKAARTAGHAIIGCYHSHPDGKAQPSTTDLAGAGEDNFLWLIASSEDLAAFVYLRGRFTGADWVTSSE